MINSLVTDSHTKPSLGQISNLNMTKSMASNVTLHSGLSSTRNSADSVSFGGYPAAKMANSDEAKKLVELARKKFSADSAKISNKKVVSFLSDVVDAVINPKTEFTRISKDLVSETNSPEMGEAIAKLSQKADGLLPKVSVDSEDVSKFIEENKSIVDKFASDTKSVVAEALRLDEKDDTILDILTEANKEAKTAFRTYKATENPKAYQNGFMISFLKKANESQSEFSAFFALLLAGLLRPLTLVLTSDKKNADNNKYAAAHSIASGLIGVGFALILNKPIAKGFSYLAANADTLLKNDLPSFKYVKGKGKLPSNKKVDTAKRIINMGTEIITAIPKAWLTIAMIPPLLKGVFHIEKGKKTTSPQPAVVGGNK